MNILIMGAGAIGSYIGGMLSNQNNVVLIGRKRHINKINKEGLKIYGKTNLLKKIESYEDIDKLKDSFDLIILTVKSYDTEEAVKQIKKIISDKTILLSIQNGLGNFEIIKRYISKKNIFIGITSNGVVLEKPGMIKHTGIGYTKIGNISNENKKRLNKIINVFNKSNIKTTKSHDIKKELWIKTIINSSINPLTTIFNCKNGYLLENPVLFRIVERICLESSKIARSEDIFIKDKEMFRKTIQVIKDTKENYSSMLQSCQNKKPLEIDSISGYLVNIAKRKKIDCLLNSIIYELLKKNINIIYNL